MIQITMVFGTPPLVCCVVLIPYELTNETPNGGVYVTSTTVFVMLSLFNILRFPLVVLPKAIRAVSEAQLAISNLQSFLAQPIARKQEITGAPDVCFKGATFQHSTDPNDSFKLNIPDFSIKPGELVAVVGQVGAGKSSLLQAILGNMNLVSPHNTYPHIFINDSSRLRLRSKGRLIPLASSPTSLRWLGARISA